MLRRKSGTGCWDKIKRTLFKFFWPKKVKIFFMSLTIQLFKKVKNLFPYLIFVCHTILTRKNLELSFVPSDHVWWWSVGVHEDPSPTFIRIGQTSKLTYLLKYLLNNNLTSFSCIIEILHIPRLAQKLFIKIKD